MKKLIVTLLLAASPAIGMAQIPKVVLSDDPGWHKIGETTVSMETETDDIRIIGADHFHTIKMKVSDAPIHLISFEIFFEDDKKQTVALGEEIKASGETRKIPIDGGARSIKKVKFNYRTVANATNQKAHVELWGLKGNADMKRK